MYSYVPSLKAKRGEKFALKYLTSETKASIKPILNVISETFSANAYYDSPAFVDNHDQALTDASDAAIIHRFKTIRENSQQINGYTSVLRYGFTENVLKEIAQYLFNIQDSVALRIPRASLNHLRETLDQISATIGIDPTHIELIIDFGSVNDIAVNYADAVADSISKALDRMKLKSVIALGYCFPEGISSPSNTIGTIPRYDWLFFKAIREKLPYLVFGDCGSDDPIDPVINSRLNIVPTIRYTIDDCWKIVRGEYDTRAPFNYGQFVGLCTKLINQKFYMGENYSWGDKTIYQCANHQCNTGNLETWVRVAMNHHITFVANECVRFPST